MIDVLLAEDQEMVRAGSQMVLEAEGDISVVGAVGSGDAAVSAAERLRPDVVLMDIRMPGMNGQDATRLITAMADAPRVVEAVRAAADGDALVSPSITMRLLGELAAGSLMTATTHDLSVRELEIATARAIGQLTETGIRSRNSLGSGASGRQWITGQNFVVDGNEMADSRRTGMLIFAGIGLWPIPDAYRSPPHSPVCRGRVSSPRAQSRLHWRPPRSRPYSS